MTNFPCPPAAIIFDMDGLLVDSERLWKQAETDLLAARGVAYSEEKHAPFIGMGMGEFIPNIKRVYELQDDAAVIKDELIERILVIIQQDTQPMPGAFDIVDWVVAQGMPYAVASSSPLKVIGATLGSQSQWDGLFPVRASAEEVPNGKPAPDVYLLAAERLGVDPTQCVALEDSPNGSRAAVAAGMTCFSVPDTSHSQPEAFTGITPHVLGNLHEALARLRGC